MAKRIPRRVREEAILIAAISASDEHRSRATDCIRSELSDEASDLFFEAWKVAHRHWPGEPLISGVIDAEAEAMLRTGWSPP